MATITITGTGTPLSFAVGATVSVAALPVVAGATYSWVFLDKPDGSAAAFAAPSAQATSFTADVAGTYFIQVVINSVDVGRAITTAPYLVDTSVATLRPPAAGEQLEESSVYGWARELQKLFKHAVLSADTGKSATGNKDMLAQLTAADYDVACNTALAELPLNGGYVTVFVNGVQYPVGDGVRTSFCYFSDDAGATAKTFATIAVGDKLYWVGSVATFQLAATDRIEFMYTVGA